MRLVKEVIRPFRLDDMRMPRARMHEEGAAAGEVRGFGRQRGRTQFYRGAKVPVIFQSKVEVAVPGESGDAILGAVLQSGHTGRDRRGNEITTRKQGALA